VKRYENSNDVFLMHTITFSQPPIKDYATAATTATYNHPQLPVAQKAKAPILNASGSAVTALSAVPMHSTPQQCDDKCDTTTTNATPQ